MEPTGASRGAILMGQAFVDHPSRRLLCALLLACVLPAGCSVPQPDRPASTYELDFSMPAGSTVRGVVVFVVDGLDSGVFNELLDAGELPTFKKYFIDRGLYAPRAVANIPSVTLANLVSLATGKFCGHHGIVGVNWFDRNRLVWRNYDTIAQKNHVDEDYVCPNIYEMLPTETTVSLFFQPHRRASKFIEQWTSAGPPFFFRWYEFVDRLTLLRFNVILDIARQQRRWPGVTYVYQLAPDFRAYHHGADSVEYRSAIRHSDTQIGRVLADMERAGLLDKLHLALVTDHAHGQTTRHFIINDLLRKVGLQPSPEQLWKEPFEERLEAYSKVNVVTYGSGERYWAISLRKPIRQDGRVVGFEPWVERPSPEDLAAYPTIGRGPCEQPRVTGQVDLLKTLADQPAVDAIAYSPGDGRVRVRRAVGEVEFRQAAPREPISYRLISGEDPLGWAGRIPAEALAGAPLSPWQWLEATADTDFPDLPAQITAYFRSRYAGDVAAFAAPGWDFTTLYKSGHGGLRPEDMLVPFAIAGPGVPHGVLKTARTVDLVPTILQLLGEPVPADLDGRSLLPVTND